MKRVFRGVLFCPLHRGKSGAARIGGGERSEPVSRIVFMSYDTESKSRNADFISIAAERQSATLGAKGPVKPKNPWAEGPSILRTFPVTTLLHNPPPSGGHNPRGEAPSTFPSEPFEPYEPSRRRRVQKACPKKTVLPEKREHCFFLPAFMTISPASGQRSLFPFLLRPVLRTRRRRGSRTRCAIRRRWHRRCRRQR